MGCPRRWHTGLKRHLHRDLTPLRMAPSHRDRAVAIRVHIPAQEDLEVSTLGRTEVATPLDMGVPTRSRKEWNPRPRMVPPIPQDTAASSPHMATSRHTVLLSPRSMAASTPHTDWSPPSMAGRSLHSPPIRDIPSPHIRSHHSRAGEVDLSTRRFVRTANQWVNMAAASRSDCMVVVSRSDYRAAEPSRHNPSHRMVVGRLMVVGTQPHSPGMTGHLVVAREGTGGQYGALACQAKPHG
jgi:hypothetical protein